MILLTGATGTIGTEVLKQLQSRNVAVRAMVRDTSKAETLRQYGVEVVQGDFDHPETLHASLQGIERAFLLTNSTERAETQQLAFVEAARQHGVSHIVKVSQLHASHDSPVRFLRYHAAVESAIQASGIAYTFLRPNLFMQGLLNFRSTIVDQHAFYAAAGDAKVSLVDIRDIAQVAVAALTEDHHANKIYNLTGPQALTHAELAATLSTVLGYDVGFVDVPSNAMREAVIGMQMPVWQADGLIEDYAHYRRGEAEAVESGVYDATGKQPRTFEAFVRDYAEQFA